MVLMAARKAPWESPWVQILIRDFFPIREVSIRRRGLRSALEKDTKLRGLFTNLETRISQE
jgi:hypothetical protein